jgi:hypothetical protein
VRHTEPEKIALPLRDLRDLFTAPEFDPAIDSHGGEPDTVDAFADALYEPGIDYLLSRLRGSRLARRGRLVLMLPPDKLEPDMGGKARRAIDRYCRHKILETKRTLNELL